MVRRLLLTILAGVAVSSFGMGEVVILRQTFDTLLPPSLPSGWTSSQNRVGGQSDFFTVGSSAHSSPNALQCTNATVEQWVSTPALVAGGTAIASVAFWTRRSGTFSALVVVECGPDNEGAPFVVVGDTLRFSGSTLYEPFTIRLPDELTMNNTVRFRWRLIPSTSGSTGTFRIDDIEVRGQCRVDLECVSAIVTPPFPSTGQFRAMRATVRNRGLVTATDILVRVLLRRDADSVRRPVDELTSARVQDSLPPGDSILVDLQIRVPPPGGTLFAVVVSPGDQDPTNDSTTTPVPVGYPPGTMVVNEIMSAPLAHDPEWVEILNTATDTLSVCRWTLCDAEGSAKHLLCKTELRIPPAGFALLTGDSLGLQKTFGRPDCPVVQIPGFPSLNNDGDQVVLADHTGSTIDSVAYSSTWHNSALVSSTGRSLERISPLSPSNESRSWTSCTALQGATPGRRNSVFIGERLAHVGLRCIPNPFSPDNDGVDDVALIQYTTPLPVATLSAYVYDVRGQRIRRLADHDPGCTQGVLVWDGRRDDGVRAPVGMYIVVLRAVQPDGTNLVEARCVVVLATRL